MIRCWEEMFANLPELSGMMLTAGEFSYCRGDVCTGGEQSSIFDESKSEEINDPRLRTRLGFIEDGRRLTESLGKELIVRGWGMEQWRDLLPPRFNLRHKIRGFRCLPRRARPAGFGVGTQRTPHMDDARDRIGKQRTDHLAR
jgi:hypothetical protein